MYPERELIIHYIYIHIEPYRDKRMGEKEVKILKQVRSVTVGRIRKDAGMHSLAKEKNARKSCNIKKGKGKFI